MNVAPYITASEYRCSHCGTMPVEYDSGAHTTLFSAFKDIREAWGKAITINSGYRCLTHNIAIMGAPLSAHLWGLALDLRAKDAGETDDLFALIDEIHGELRIGTSKKPGAYFLHIDNAYDIRPRPLAVFVESARWKY